MDKVQLVQEGASPWKCPECKGRGDPGSCRRSRDTLWLGWNVEPEDQIPGDKVCRYGDQGFSISFSKTPIHEFSVLLWEVEAVINQTEASSKGSPRQCQTCRKSNGNSLLLAMVPKWFELHDATQNSNTVFSGAKSHLSGKGSHLEGITWTCNLSRLHHY